jgi:hypothetical protein
MMYGWSFAARTLDEVERLLQALGKHRYLRAIDHRLHWSVDAALARCGAEPFGSRACHRADRLARLELGSRDPELWSSATTNEVVAALTTLWSERDARDALAQVLRDADIPAPAHAPFAADPDDPPHPELVLLDWGLYAVDELDGERHAGALAAMAEAEEEVSASDPPWVEGPTLSQVELCAPLRGVLPSDPVFWADGPYAYCDYVFRGVARAAKLVEPPLGYRDFD